MVTLLVSNNSALFRQLAGRAFSRVGARWKVATSGPEVLALARKDPPALAILDIELPELDGYEVCRQIKKDPDLSDIRVILVFSSVLSRDQLMRLEECGCDDLFCVPAPSDELYQHVAQLLGFPSRGSRRIVVQLRVELKTGTRILHGHLINLSLDGAKIGLDEPLGAVSELSVRLERGEHMAASAVKARRVWERENEEGFESVVGVQFEEMSAQDRRVIGALSLWDANTGDDGTEQVALQGDLSETTDFSDLVRHLHGVRRAEFDLSGIRHVNSWGVRVWIAFLDQLHEQLEYAFVRASTVMVMQAGMVPRALGRGKILSLFAPYHCDRCDRTEDRLLQAASVQKGLLMASPRFSCSRCGGTAELDDVPARYFAFLG